MRSFLWGLMGLATACSGRPPQHPEGELPSELVLRVDHVRVSALRPSTSNPWDEPTPVADAGAVCKLSSMAASAAWSPVAGDGVDLICGLAVPSKPTARRAEQPDLMLRLGKGTSEGLVSPVIPDVTSATFRYEFVVPVSAIPPEGVTLEVLDSDPGLPGEVIGLTRITQETLRKAWASSSHLLEVQAGGVQGLEIVVSPYRPLTVPATSRSASYAPGALSPRALMAGEVVTVRASGRYTVGSFYDQTIDPAGYPDGDAKRYNFKQEPFRDARHACAIALIGDTSVRGVVVGRELTFVSPSAGALRVGLNDTDPGNNHGTLTFALSTRAPTPSEWLSSRP